MPGETNSSDREDPKPTRIIWWFMFGGPCEFLGYPLGGGWRGKWDAGASYWMPYIKHCTVSGTIGTQGCGF
jgi:hypothetical protein